MKTNRNLMALLAACGTAATVAGVANAQPYVVNISGATLLENFFRAPASTNDFLDLDGDGIASPNVDNLNNFQPSNPYNANLYFVQQYRATGSIRGFAELVAFGQTFVTSADPSPTPPTATELASAVAQRADCNRTLYINNSARTGIANANHPGAAPVKSDQIGTAAAPVNVTATTFVPTPGTATGGIRIDIAPVDVPARWAVVGPVGTAAPDDVPTAVGYGRNPRTATDRFGATPSGTVSNQLTGLGTLNLFDPNNPGAANDNSIFDTSLAYAPIACVTNLGTGLNQLTFAQLRHIFATGRMPSGVNLVVVTRDSGSGTRNGFNNTNGLDPSYGVGDNVGAVSGAAAGNNLGTAFVPSNKNGNAAVELTAINARLGIGYAGAERGVTGGGPEGSWLSLGKLECIGVQRDGGVAFARPDIDSILDNSVANGYTLGGPAVLSTIGDPRSAPVARGGDVANTNPDMRNEAAAAYINNITRSVAAFIAVPGGPATDFSPGEFLAQQFVLTAALDNATSPTNPSQLIVPNPAFNAAVQADARTRSVLTNPAFDAFGTVTLNGLVPTRNTVAATYSDQALVPGGNQFITQGGGLVNYATPLTDRNRIAGDFSGDGARTTADVTDMIAAWRQRNAGPAWTAPNGTGPILGAPGTTAIIEVLGDFDCNGSFNAADVRFWGDGLHVVGGSVNRAAGFLAIDNTFGGNFFNTVLATGTFTNGESRADIATSTLTVARGFAPNADGLVNSNDITYAYRQFKSNPGILDGAATWSSLAEAILFDLSADMTGDLVVDQNDVCDIVRNVLNTTFGDVNLDGSANSADLATISGNIGVVNSNATWAQGDVDGNGAVQQADLELARGYACPGNANRDGDVSFADVTSILTNFNANYGCLTGPGDSNADGVVNFADITSTLTNFNAVCN